MKIISTSDIIYATVLSCGRTIYRATFAGMSSAEDIYNAVRRAAKETQLGPATVTLRNSTQGWSMKRAMTRSRPLSSQSEAVQLSLF